MHLETHNMTLKKQGKLESGFKLWVVLSFTAFLVAAVLSTRSSRLTASAATVSGFLYSTPITLNKDGSELWVVNPDPDNNTVTVVDVKNDAGRVIREIPVGSEPNSIALNGDGSFAYVANTV